MAEPVPTIPVLVVIDVEPDGFFIGRTENVPWSGFERALRVMAAVRDALSRATGHDAHFTWLVRADEQIAETYGSAGWAFEHYRSAFETLLAARDEVGLHVHAYRWQAPALRWVEDYGNQEWVERCVRTGFRAFEQHFARSPASFSMGMEWTNQATIRLVRGLEVRYDFSPILGKEPQPFPPRDTYTGVAPDCSRIPDRPYRPSPDDFCRAASEPEDGMWLFPHLSRVARIRPSWKRGLWDLVHLRPVAPRTTRKFFLPDDPSELQPAVDAMLHRLEHPYLTFAVRTDEFRSPDTTAIIRRNLESVLDRHEEQRFAFTRPDEALRILGFA
jgi:hypothetical protein